MYQHQYQVMQPGLQFSQQYLHPITPYHKGQHQQLSQLGAQPLYPDPNQQLQPTGYHLPTTDPNSLTAVAPLEQQQHYAIPPFLVLPGSKQPQSSGLGGVVGQLPDHFEEKSGEDLQCVVRPEPSQEQTGGKCGIVVRQQQQSSSVTQHTAASCSSPVSTATVSNFSDNREQHQSKEVQSS